MLCQPGRSEGILVESGLGTEAWGTWRSQVVMGSGRELQAEGRARAKAQVARLESHRVCRCQMGGGRGEVGVLSLGPGEGFGLCPE